MLAPSPMYLFCLNCCLEAYFWGRVSNIHFLSFNCGEGVVHPIFSSTWRWFNREKKKKRRHNPFIHPEFFTSAFKKQKQNQSVCPLYHTLLTRRLIQCSFMMRRLFPILHKYGKPLSGNFFFVQTGCKTGDPKISRDHLLEFGSLG